MRRQRVFWEGSRLRLTEYDSKQILKAAGLPVPEGSVVTSASAAARVAAALGRAVVVKAQIPSGRRGKAGGVKFANDAQGAREIAEEILGKTIHDFTVSAVAVEEKLAIDQEIYLSFAIDSAAKKVVLVASAHGGMDIEEVADELIVKVHLDPDLGMQQFIARDVVRKMGMPLGSAHAREIIRIMCKMYEIFTERDAELVEINPLVVSGDRLVALDAKISIDDSALFRQASHLESRAADSNASGMSFVHLGGDIGVIANGAGITMATLDTIHYYGGRAANFLDIGGGASKETMARALDTVLSLAPSCLLINIFGGITRCDDVARGIVDVVSRTPDMVPLVVRLVGTNQEEGRQILKAGAGASVFDRMEDAVKEAVRLASKAGSGGGDA